MKPNPGKPTRVSRRTKPRSESDVIAFRLENLEDCQLLNTKAEAAGESVHRFVGRLVLKALQGGGSLEDVTCKIDSLRAEVSALREEIARVAELLAAASKVSTGEATTGSDNSLAPKP